MFLIKQLNHIHSSEVAQQHLKNVALLVSWAGVTVCGCIKAKVKLNIMQQSNWGAQVCTFWISATLWKVCSPLTVHLVAVVTAPWWRGSVGGAGRDQSIEGESSAAAALSSVRRWAVLIQATRARTSRELQWWAVGFVQKKTQTERRGMQESAPQLADSRDKRSGEPADQSPAKSTLHLERRQRKGQH